MPTSSHIRDTIAGLEKRRAELDDSIREAVAERDEIDAVLEVLRRLPQRRRGKDPASRDEAKEIRALITASPHGLDAEEIAARSDLAMTKVRKRLATMVENGEITQEKGRYVTKSVVPGAGVTRRTTGATGHPPDVSRS